MADEIYDVVIVGAGFAGIHQSYRIRELGLKFLTIDQAGGVGGTWYWNLYDLLMILVAVNRTNLMCTDTQELCRILASQNRNRI